MLYSVVATEDHFLLNRLYYYMERVHFFYIIFYENDIFEGDHSHVFANIRSSTDGKIIFSICKFVLKCFKKRNENSPV